MLWVLLLLRVVQGALYENFCWEEYQDVAIHTYYDPDSIPLGMSQTPVDNFQECLRQCGVRKTCVGVSWRESGDPEHPNFNNCFFIKRNGGKMAEAPEFHTALKVRCEESVCWKESMNYAYNKFNDNAAVETFFSPSSPVLGFQDCLDRCSHSNKCQAVTWREGGDPEHEHFGKCWFMSQPGNGVALEGFRSARRVSCNPDEREGDELVCGIGTQIDVETNSCVPDGVVEVLGTPGRIKGDLVKPMKGSDTSTLANCEAACLAIDAKGFSYDPRKKKCKCVEKIKLYKEFSFIGRFDLEM